MPNYEKTLFFIFFFGSFSASQRSGLGPLAYFCKGNNTRERTANDLRMLKQDFCLAFLIITFNKAKKDASSSKKRTYPVNRTIIFPNNEGIKSEP